jgi:tRNA(Ile)-lysidine synthase
MLNSFKKFIEENKIINPDDRILIAVSGGIDSMVMAHLFSQLSYETGIAHCNFSLRARESDKDEELVHRYADKNNIPFYSTRFQTKTYAKEMGLSVQMAARELRYEWFEEIRRNNRFDSIAVAHNLNDNIETMIINLTRGSGLAGLSGMKTVSNHIIRPLLFATRQDITAYCHQHNIIYREDRSNTDTKYTRNKIRHLVIPVLKEINPSIETTLNETAERFAGMNEIITGYIKKLREKVSEQKENCTYFNISLLKPHLQNKTIIFELFKPFGITGLQLNDLIKVIKGETGGQIYTESCRLIKNRKELIISCEEISNDQVYIADSVEDIGKIAGIVSAEYADVTEIFQIHSDPSVACVDSEKILFPLTVRKWKPGDYFYPLGMKQKKKLSDYFIDNKYSLLDKESILILESDGKIVWIIGDRIDNRFKITRSTRKALIIKSAKKTLIIKPLK